MGRYFTLFIWESIQSLCNISNKKFHHRAIYKGSVEHWTHTLMALGYLMKSKLLGLNVQ